MDIKFTPQKEGLRAVIRGDLDMLSANELRTLLDAELQNTAKRHLILDLAGVSFIDTSGLGVIVGRARKLAPFGGKVSVCASNERVYRILTLSGVNKIMAVRGPEEAEVSAGEG
ncbi:MAG: STAS domain-containing protein [Clostridiales bacterium]|nr:STAS domain-containing protein [Clostridiales bacterium]